MRKISNQLFRLNEIVALRQMGFSISEITTIVDGHNIAGILEQRRLELERELQTATSQLFRLTNYINEQKEGQTMKYQAVVKEIPGYLVYSTQYTLPNYAALMEIMPALGEKVSKANPDLKCVEPGYCFNVYLDSEYRDTDIQIETCEAVTSWGKDGDGIIFKEIPPITAVTVPPVRHY